jgi:hypothetical protein
MPARSNERDAAQLGGRETHTQQHRKAERHPIGRAPSPVAPRAVHKATHVNQPQQTGPHSLAHRSTLDQAIFGLL